MKTRAMLARGAKAPISSDDDVGVVVHVHMKHNHENVTTPQINHLRENKYRNSK
jgi:hypothetical protein